MSNSHNVRDLSPEARQVVEQLLGRPLEENEQISLHAYKVSEEPSSAAKQEALRDLRALWARADEKTKDIPEEEWEEIVDEAMRSVRPGYRRIP